MFGAPQASKPQQLLTKLQKAIQCLTIKEQKIKKSYIDQEGLYQLTLSQTAQMKEKDQLYIQKILTQKQNSEGLQILQNYCKEICTNIHQQAQNIELNQNLCAKQIETLIYCGKFIQEQDFYDLTQYLEKELKVNTQCYGVTMNLDIPTILKFEEVSDTSEQIKIYFYQSLQKQSPAIQFQRNDRRAQTDQFQPKFLDQQATLVQSQLSNYSPVQADNNNQQTNTFPAQLSNQHSNQQNRQFVSDFDQEKEKSQKEFEQYMQTMTQQTQGKKQTLEDLLLSQKTKEQINLLGVQNQEKKQVNPFPAQIIESKMPQPQFKQFDQNFEESVALGQSQTLENQIKQQNQGAFLQPFQQQQQQPQNLSP